MRVTILFFLVAGILALTIWAWSAMPSETGSLPFNDLEVKYQQIEKINKFTDMSLLKAHAISLVDNAEKKAFEREVTIMKSMNFIALTILIAFIALILLFLEIAARGRKVSK